MALAMSVQSPPPSSASVTLAAILEMLTRILSVAQAMSVPDLVAVFTVNSMSVQSSGAPKMLVGPSTAVVNSSVVNSSAVNSSAHLPVLAVRHVGFSDGRSALATLHPAYWCDTIGAARCAFGPSSTPVSPPLRLVNGTTCDPQCTSRRCSSTSGEASTVVTTFAGMCRIMTPHLVGPWLTRPPFNGSAVVNRLVPAGYLLTISKAAAPSWLSGCQGWSRQSGRQTVSCVVPA